MTPKQLTQYEVIRILERAAAALDENGPRRGDKRALELSAKAIKEGKDEGMNVYYLMSRPYVDEKDQFS